MLVHYAVDIKRLPRHKQWQESVLPHQCEGLDDLVSELRHKFQLGAVLHGHIHVPCLYNHDGAQVVSATTTFGQGGPNGFFVLKVLDTGEIRAEHHVWNGIRFAPDPDTSLNKSIALYPTRTAFTVPAVQCMPITAKQAIDGSFVVCELTRCFRSANGYVLRTVRARNLQIPNKPVAFRRANAPAWTILHKRRSDVALDCPNCHAIFTCGL
jgi:hypothetical protein